MSLLDTGALLTTFVLILPAELPDKTFVATLVLASRFPRWPVWIGVASAFLVQCTIAVLAGGLLGLLPPRLVSAIAAGLFAIGAVIMLRGALVSRRQAAEEEAAIERDEEAAIERAAHGTGAGMGPLKVAATSFTVLFVAEWGDLSQLFTAAQAARTGAPVSVLIGAWTALALVAGAAVLAGGWLRDRVPLHRVRLVSAGILAVLALITALDAIRG
jgi:putative Ca2+/H+ antiporter (TMEM165/GDT1 family)